jgi:hypothetical protein
VCGWNYRRCSDIILRLQRFQSEQYNYPELGVLQNYLSSLPILNESFFYTHSLACEGKKSVDEVCYYSFEVTSNNLINFSSKKAEEVEKNICAILLSQLRVLYCNYNYLIKESLVIRHIKNIVNLQNGVYVSEFEFFCAKEFTFPMMISDKEALDLRYLCAKNSVQESLTATFELYAEREAFGSRKSADSQFSFITYQQFGEHCKRSVNKNNNFFPSPS